jgi:hypothetical protein
MARLHRENRYDRATDDVERLSGVPAQTIEAFVAERRDFYLSVPLRSSTPDPPDPPIRQQG